MKTVASIIGLVYVVFFVLAIYLAIRDMQFLQSTSTKVWVIILAICMPELYCILHGISSSAQGVSFFAGSPMPGGGGGGAGSVMPTMSPFAGGSMTGLTPESSLG